MLRHDVRILSTLINQVLNSRSKVYLLRHCSLNTKNSNILFFGEKSDIPTVVVLMFEIVIIVDEYIRSK